MRDIQQLYRLQAGSVEFTEQAVRTCNGRSAAGELERQYTRRLQSGAARPMHANQYRSCINTDPGD